MKIVYFGKPYSFSHIAAMRRFKKDNEYISGNTINATISSVLNNENTIAVVPIENTTGGIIYDTVDNMVTERYLKSNMVIAEELELNINLFIAAKNKIKLSQVSKIYSHEVVLRRTMDWISRNLPDNVEVLSVLSTSEAVQKAKNEKYSCAIASKEAINHYGLFNIKQVNVKGKKNITRFFVIAQNEKENKRRI